MRFTFVTSVTLALGGADHSWSALLWVMFEGWIFRLWVGVRRFSS